MTDDTRIEKDTMGPMKVPSWALWGASTQRAVENFPISGRPLPPAFIHAYGHLKAACADVNLELSRLDEERHAAIVKAAGEIAAGTHDRHFPIDVFQTGSGTSTNMNLNEVISSLCKPLAVHPNDHVNMGQSSNDTFPTAMHLSATLAIQGRLLPALARMAERLEAQAKGWDDVVKIGRTHLQDATPIRLGQEFSGYASQIRHGEARARRALEVLSELALGGTAVGTGINTHEEFGKRVAAKLAQRLKLPLREADNHFEAQQAKDAFVEVSGHLKTIAISLGKIANDIRWMGSGPRSGLGELKLPAVQPGSSIMPGKVNPVIAEAAIMVQARVIGNDATIATAALGGVGSILDLNVAMPVMAEAMLDSIDLLANAATTFTAKLLDGLEPDRERATSLIEGSLAMATSLVPVIGYDKAAALAKQALAEGKTVRQLAMEQKLLPKDELDKLLDPHAMTLPGGEGSGGG
jgi:fumarate hydratase class II